MKTLSEIIGDCIVDELAAVDRDQAISGLVDILIDCGKLDPSLREEAILALLKREATGSTGMGSGVALPHAKVDFVPDFTGVLGRLTEGIDFGGQEVHVVFLFFSPERAISGHLELMAHISGILRNPEYVEKLRGAHDEDALARLVERAEDYLFEE